MAARGEIDMDEYDDEDGARVGGAGDEPEFDNEEEYIDYYVDQKMKELRAQGSNMPEAEVRKQITAQIMAEQQEQEDIDLELEEAIAQMSKEELA